jgi:hypothetical protein
MTIRFGILILLLTLCQQVWADTDPVQLLSKSCHYEWQQYNWTMGEGYLAQDNVSVDEGIKRICQAKAELYLEGYEITPSIADEEQEEVFRLVFLPSVELIKTQLKVYLPKLRVL